MSPPVLTPAGCLRQAREALRRRALFQAVAAATGVLAAGLLGADGLNFLWPWREATACAAIAGLGLLAVGVLAASVFRSLSRFPDLPALALRVEAARPEFLDAFVCSVEIEAKPEATRGPLERALLERMSATSAAAQYLPLLLPPALRWPRMLLLAALYAALLAAALHTPVLAKARWFLADWRAGAGSGLVVTPGTAAVPEHSDVTVTVGIRRWEPLPEIVYADRSGRHRFPMTLDRDRQAVFTFFGLEHGVRYRVLTPSLASPWYTLSLYTPPVARELSGRVVPPAYTRLPVREFTRLDPLKAVAGSQVELRVLTAPTVTATLTVNGTALPASTAEPGRSVFSMPVTTASDSVVSLADREGHTAMLQPWRIDCIPDTPPVLEMQPPPDDIDLPVGGTLTVAVRATDDFGLRAVFFRYAFSGGPRQATAVFQADPAAAPLTEKTGSITLTPKPPELKPGDVITGFFEALDNRQPQPQVTRSPVYFITIRGPLPKPKADGAGGAHQVNLAALIAEQKRLIRATWDALARPASEAAARRDELANGLAALAAGIKKEMQGIVDVTGLSPNGPGAIVTPMDSAAHETELAGKLAGRELLEESVPPQERSLAYLTAVEWQLMQNTQPSQSPSKSSGKSGEQSGKPAESQPAQAKPAEVLARLRDLIAEGRRLAAAQQTLNDQTNEAELAGTALQAAQARQQTLEQDTTGYAARLAALAFAQRAAREATAAGSTMAEAGRALARAATDEGHRQGTHAQGLLLAAVQSLESTFRQTAAALVQELAESARRQAAGQSQEAVQSNGLAQTPAAATAAAATARRGAQAAAQKDATQLLQSIAESAQALDETTPAASEALTSAARQARDGGLDAAMARASNALLYQRFDKAAQNQTAAAAALQQLAERLTAALRLLPTVSREELQQLLAKIRAARELWRQIGTGPAAAQAAQFGQLQRALAPELEAMALQVPDPDLQKLGREFGSPLGADTAGAGERLGALLETADKTLERLLLRTELKQALTVKKKTYAMPETYRQQIERYFRALSEGE